MSRKLCIALAMVVGIGFSARTSRAAITAADVIVVVDESGSMSGEHAWISTMITALDAELNLAGVTSNQYGLVGFGGSGSHLAGHKHLVNGGDFGNAAQFGAATGSLVLNGGTEDGYSGINTALNAYTLRPGAVTNVILVTDEDRDVVNAALNFANVLADLNSKNALLNVVVNAQLRDAANAVALGLTPTHSYTKDLVGGFTKTLGGSVASASGTTEADYINMAFASGGAAWDLNQLRVGGLTADSFTAAFVDLKVQEIITAPGDVPEPGTFAIWGILSLVGIGVARRKRKAAAAA